MCLRDWSLIIRRGGKWCLSPMKTGGGGGAENVLAMLKAGPGGTKDFEVVLTQELEV